MNKQNKKRSAAEVLIDHLAGILFVLGLITVDVAVFLLFGTAIGVLATGISLIVTGLIVSFEAANAVGRG